MLRIDAREEDYRLLNEKIRECSQKEITLNNVMGQRYIGCGLAGRRIIINAWPAGSSAG